MASTVPSIPLRGGDRRVSSPVATPVEADKGLKKNAVGMLSSVVIGIASTAPAYSLAVTLGLIVVVAGIGLKSPAIMLVSFVPMILIASSYYYLNKADPDCGTTFSWVTRAIGPRTGWVTGWVMVAADIIVMASLAQITGTYFFLLFGLQQPRELALLGDDGGRRLPRHHVRDHRHRHRDLGPAAVVPARVRVPHARDLLGRRADQGLHRRIPRARSIRLSPGSCPT